MKDQTKLYGTIEMAEILGMSRCSLSELCQRRRLTKKDRGYKLTVEEWRSILLKKYHKKLPKRELEDKGKPIPEVIYVTRTTEIIHSKMNFLELNHL